MIINIWFKYDVSKYSFISSKSLHLYGRQRLSLSVNFCHKKQKETKIYTNATPTRLRPFFLITCVTDGMISSFTLRHWVLLAKKYQSHFLNLSPKSFDISSHIIWALSSQKSWEIQGDFFLLGAPNGEVCVIKNNIRWLCFSK